jgi:hypothetical protein
MTTAYFDNCVVSGMVRGDPPLKSPPHLLAPVSEVQRIHGALETDLKRTSGGFLLE